MGKGICWIQKLHKRFKRSLKLKVSYLIIELIKYYLRYTIIEGQCMIKGKMGYSITSVAIVLFVITSGCVSMSPRTQLPTTQTPTAPVHVIVIPFENHKLADWMKDPYFVSLAKKYGSATNFHGFSGISQPDYLIETSGDNHGITGDSFTLCQYNVPNIYDVLTRNGLTFENFEESGDQGNHRHTPGYFYPSTCHNVQDMSKFISKYINGNEIPPSYVWVTPNFMDDAHDSDVPTASNWLKNTLKFDILLSKPWFLDGSTLVILVCDDGGSTFATTLLLAISTSSMGTTSNKNYSHINVLSTAMWWLGLTGSIGNANASFAMKDLFRQGRHLAVS